MELGGSLVNQLRAPPFKDVGNTSTCRDSYGWYMRPYVHSGQLCHHTDPCWSPSTCPAVELLWWRWWRGVSKPSQGCQSSWLTYWDRTHHPSHGWEPYPWFPHCSRVGRGCEWPADNIRLPSGWSSLHQLLPHVLIMQRAWISCSFFLVTFSFFFLHLGYPSLQRQNRHLVGLTHPLHASGWCHLLLLLQLISLGPAVGANCSC